MLTNGWGIDSWKDASGVYHSIDTHPDDVIFTGSTDCDGETYTGLWWEHGVARSAERMVAFVAEYIEQGGPSIDYLVADTEKWLSVQSVGVDQTELCTVQKWQAVQTDPRIIKIVAQVKNLRPEFTYDISLPGSLSDSLCRRGNRNAQCYANVMAWDAVGFQRVAEATNIAFFAPLKQYYPNISFSNYGFKAYSSDFPVPERNGALSFMYPSSALNGNQQSFPHYGSFSIGASNALIATVPGLVAFERTPFNAMLYDVNALRAQRLTEPNREVKPWITCKHQDGSPPSTLLYTSRYYEEMILHLALTGVDSFIAWQPYTSWSPYCNPNYDDNRLLSSLLSEINIAAGCASSLTNRSIVGGLAPWSADFLLSGVVIGSQATFRFTPRMAENATLDTYVQTGLGEGHVMVTTGGSPTSASCFLLFQEAEVLTVPDSYATGGLWITQQRLSSGFFPAIGGNCSNTATAIQSLNGSPWSYQAETESESEPEAQCDEDAFHNWVCSHQDATGSHVQVASTDSRVGCHEVVISATPCAVEQGLVDCDRLHQLCNNELCVRYAACMRAALDATHCWASGIYNAKTFLDTRDLVCPLDARTQQCAMQALANGIVGSC
jgi:hypothetical protein